MGQDSAFITNVGRTQPRLSPRLCFQDKEARTRWRKGKGTQCSRDSHSRLQSLGAAGAEGAWFTTSKKVDSGGVSEGETWCCPHLCQWFSAMADISGRVPVTSVCCMECVSHSRKSNCLWEAGIRPFRDMFTLHDAHNVG